MKNLILIGIVTLIAMSACGDREKDPIFSRTHPNAKIPANSKFDWILQSDSSYLLKIQIDTTNDAIADIDVLITPEAMSNKHLASVCMALFYYRNKDHNFGNIILERKLSGVYLRQLNQ